MPKIFWFAIGGLVLAILFAVAGNWGNAIGTFIITALVCAAYEKLEQWGFVTTTYKIKEEPRQSIGPIISKSMEPPQPDLPPPNPPEPVGPLKGLMRADVTQTDKTVDVYVTLAEQAIFIINNKNLGAVPIEQNFEKFSEHMALFKTHLRGFHDETDANVASQLRGDALENFQKKTSEWRQEERAREPQELREEEQRYKERNTVYLKDYLKFPYRKVVANPIEAATYMKRLEAEYLPKIKLLIENASAPKTKSFEF